MFKSIFIILNFQIKIFLSMGIIVSHIHFLAMENNNNPIKGNVLTIGQQAVHCTLENSKKIINLYTSLKPLKAGFDTDTKISEMKGSGYTNANALFSLLGADNVYVCDYSNYENADFVFDLNYPVDEGLKEKFDVIFDAGTLEHVFDIATALNNYDYMLKKGGRIIIMSPTSNAIDHGFYGINPTLYFDYFKAYNYLAFSCYLRETNPYNIKGKGKTFKYIEVGDQMVMFSAKMVEVYFFANKSIEDRDFIFKKPIQTLYKNTYAAIQPSIQISQTKSAINKLVLLISNIIPLSIKLFLLDLKHNRKLKNKKSNITYIGKI